MAADVQVITGVQPKPEIAARLCNFASGHSELLATHTAWLDQNVRPVVMKLISPWVDLFGYASRRGSSQSNQVLSEKRCAAVKAHIATYKSDIRFPQEFGKGEEESEGVEDDDDGYWRAVSFFVYGIKPAVRPRIPRFKRIGSTQFKIRLIDGVSLSGKGAQGDFFIFQIVDIVAKQAACYTYVGGGLSVPVPGPPGSVSKAGPFVNFRTSNPVLLSTFVCAAGEAGVDQPTSITVGPKSSKLAVLDLTIKSASLRKLGAVVVQTPVVKGVGPGVLEIPTGPGFGITVAAGTVGALLMQKPPGVVPFP